MPSPAGTVADDPWSSSSSISSSPSPSPESTSWLCCPRSGAVPGVEAMRPGREAHGQRAVSGGGVHRVVDRFEEAAGSQLRQLATAVWLHDLGHGHAGIPEGLRRSRHRCGSRTSCQLLVDRIVVSSSSSGSRQLGRSPTPGCRAPRSGSSTGRRWPPRSRPSRRVGRTRRVRLCGRGSAVRR